MGDARTSNVLGYTLKIYVEVCSTIILALVNLRNAGPKRQSYNDFSESRRADAELATTRDLLAPNCLRGMTNVMADSISMNPRGRLLDLRRARSKRPAQPGTQDAWGRQV